MDAIAPHHDLHPWCGRRLFLLGVIGVLHRARGLVSDVGSN